MREIIATGKTVEEATENGCRELGLTRDEVSVEILDMPVRKLFKTTPAKVKLTVDGMEDKAVEAAKPAPQSAAKPAEKKAEKPAQKSENKPGKNKGQKAGGAPKAVLPAEPEVEINLAENKGAAAAVAYLTEIFTAMGAGEVSITAVQQGDATLLSAEGAGIADVIETRGETVQALSYLTDRAVNKGVDKKDAAYLRIRLDIAGYRNRRENELIGLATRTGKDVQKTHRSITLAPMNPYERLIVHTTISGMDGLVSESIGADTERRVVVKSTADDATDGEDWRAPRKGGNNRGRGGRGGSGSGNRGPRQNNRGPRDSGRDRDRGPQAPRTSTPEREYADKPRDPNAAPIVPTRRDALRDGEDLPLYGKIEL